MVQTDDGFAPAPGVVEAELARLALPGRSVTVQTLAPLIDSANATPDDWNRVAAAIVAGHDAHDGIIVTHGTDTLAFTAAALCFALHGLRRPVILTGAMLPLTVAGSDGTRNLSDALAAAETAPPGVWVQFAGALMHGARLRKSHSSALDAFEAAVESRPPCQPAAQLGRTSFGHHEIAALSMAPGLSERVITQVLAHCDGVVLRVFGSGTVPNSAALRAGLLDAQARGMPVIAVSQCPEGGIALGTYAAGAPLVEAGVVDGRDMTVEAAYAKLAHVLAFAPDAATRRARLAQTLCGELT